MHYILYSPSHPTMKTTIDYSTTLPKEDRHSQPTIDLNPKPGSPLDPHRSSGFFTSVKAFFDGLFNAIARAAKWLAGCFSTASHNVEPANLPVNQPPKKIQPSQTGKQQKMAAAQSTLLAKFKKEEMVVSFLHKNIVNAAVNNKNDQEIFYFYGANEDLARGGGTAELFYNAPFNRTGKNRQEAKQNHPDRFVNDKLIVGSSVLSASGKENLHIIHGLVANLPVNAIPTDRQKTEMANMLYQALDCAVLFRKNEERPVVIMGCLVGTGYFHWPTELVIDIYARVLSQYQTKRRDVPIEFQICDVTKPSKYLMNQIKQIFSDNRFDEITTAAANTTVAAAL